MSWHRSINSKILVFYKYYLINLFSHSFHWAHVLDSALACVILNNNFSVSDHLEVSQYILSSIILCLPSNYVCIFCSFWVKYSFTNKCYSHPAWQWEDLTAIRYNTKLCFRRFWSWTPVRSGCICSCACNETFLSTEVKSVKTLRSSHPL